MVITEKTNFKISIATFVTVLIFIVSTVYQTAVWKTEMEKNVEQNHIEILKTEEIQNLVVIKQSQQNAVFAEIKTDLRWIRAKLEEIK